MLARTRNRRATGNGNENNRALKANGDRRALDNPPAKLLGLTVPSSATEAGEARRNQQRRLNRQPLFAGAPC